MSDFVFCTVASKNVLPELALFVQSVRMFVGEWPIYVLWHGEQCLPMPPALYVPDTTPFDLRVVGSDKSRVISLALSKHKTVLYADCDVLFLGDWKPDLAHDGVTLSRHMSNNEGAVGRYNSGFVGVADTSFPEWWNKQPKECAGHYGDQQCLDDWQRHSGIQYEFPEQHNVGFWRLWDSLFPVPGNPREASEKCFRLQVNGDKIYYNDAPIISVHTHLLPSGSANAPLCCTFNRRVVAAMRASSDHRHKELLQFMGPNLNI